MAQNYRSQCVFGCSVQNFSFLGRLLTLVAMQADKQQRWRIYVHAKAKNFDLKLKATKILPTWMLYRFSIMLKLHQVLLKVKSESQPSMPTQGGRTLKSKFRQILEKIRARRAKNRANATNNTSNLQYPQIKFPVNLLKQFAFEEPIRISSLVVGILAFLSQLMAEKDRKGIIIHGSIIFLFLALFFRKFIPRKPSNILLIITVGIVACPILFGLNNFSKCVWKAWNYATSSRCLCGFSQEIFSRFYQYRGVWRRAIQFGYSTFKFTQQCLGFL